MFVLVVVAVVVVFGALLWWNWYLAKKRREEFAALAAARGWTWQAEDDRWNGQWAGSPFQTGHSRSSRNVLTGVHDSRPFVAFDYQYKETSTDSDGQSSTTTYDFSVVAVQSAAGLVDMTVQPEGFFGRMVGALTNSDIDFEWEEFNRAFQVKSSDRKFASDVIHQQMMEYLMAHPKTSWSLRGGWLLVVTRGRHDVAEVDQKLGFADGVLDRIPRFVWEAYGVVDPGAPGLPIDRNPSPAPTPVTDMPVTDTSVTPSPEEPA